MNKTKEQAKEILESSINIRGTITLGNYTQISIPYKDALASTIKALEAAEPKWISVEEQLPEESGYILGANAHDQFICRFNKDRSQLVALGVDIIAREDYDITHWMPLPQPPKDKDNG